jgi:hypothetical protein
VAKKKQKETPTGTAVAQELKELPPEESIDLSQSVPVTVVNINDLKHDPENPMNHGQRNKDMIRRSIEEFGPMRGIAIDSTGQIVAGNATVAAAREAGIKKVRIVDAAPDEIIAVRREMTAEARDRYAIIDNQSSRLGTFNGEVIQKRADAGMQLDMFTDKEVERLTKNQQALDLADGGNVDPPEFANPGGGDWTPPAEAQTRMVQLFLTTETHPVFMDACKALAAFFKTDNVTDTVMEAVSRAVLTIPAEPSEEAPTTITGGAETAVQ